MPATPIVCHGCGQTGHMKRDCFNVGAYNRRGRGGYQSRGGYNQSRGLDRSRMTCFKCLSKGHSVHECTVSDKQRSASSQRNFGGAPWASSGQFYGRYVCIPL
ncbi:MAG: hypothetical protein GY696_39295 [Gammaproteobacteria bacterium]|nr:hypothetical protein [Gammaproteobacteria bacterium]